MKGWLFAIVGCLFLVAPAHAGICDLFRRSHNFEENYVSYGSAGGTYVVRERTRTRVLHRGYSYGSSGGTFVTRSYGSSGGYGGVSPTVETTCPNCKAKLNIKEGNTPATPPQVEAGKKE